MGLDGKTGIYTNIEDWTQEVHVYSQPPSAISLSKSRIKMSVSLIPALPTSSSSS